jgi:hypothetical protein
MVKQVSPGRGWWWGRGQSHLVKLDKRVVYFGD